MQTIDPAVVTPSTGKLHGTIGAITNHQSNLPPQMVANPSATARIVIAVLSAPLLTTTQAPAHALLTLIAAGSTISALTNTGNVLPIGIIVAIVQVPVTVLNHQRMSDAPHTVTTIKIGASSGVNLTANLVSSDEIIALRAISVMRHASSDEVTALRAISVMHLVSSDEIIALRAISVMRHASSDEMVALNAVSSVAPTINRQPEMLRTLAGRAVQMSSVLILSASKRKITGSCHQMNSLKAIMSVLAHLNTRRNDMNAPQGGLPRLKEPLSA
jgi:hypothetical protein